jgi:hypothetical protein
MRASPATHRSTPDEMSTPQPVSARSFRPTPDGFVGDCGPNDLIYFLLNVGDGDTQLLLLPAAPAKPRRAVVVDVAGASKLSGLVDQLASTPAGAPLLPEQPKPFCLVVGTHPHQDHIGGMPRFIDRFHDQIGEFWEPGYYHPSANYIEMMRALEDHDVRHTQPTSGMTSYLGRAKLTVLSPSIGLRNRFDSYGIEINDSSISMKVDFPASRVIEREDATDPDPAHPRRRKDRTYVRLPTSQTLILGADAQTTSWAQVLADFPQLGPEKNAVNAELRKAGGVQPLGAQVFKISHHGSKHGINLELIEAIHPALSLVSSVGGAGSFQFPHQVAMELVREGLEPIASKPTASHKADIDLGIHYTGGTNKTGSPLGTIALVISPTGRRRLWRFMDAAEDPVELSNGRLFAGRT